MQHVRALPRGTGDYIHPDEELQIVDEATGTTYDLMVKSSAPRPGAAGTVFLYVPVEAVASLMLVDGYCVVELGVAESPAAGKRRVERLSAMLPS